MAVARPGTRPDAVDHLTVKLCWMRSCSETELPQVPSRDECLWMWTLSEGRLMVSSQGWLVVDHCIFLDPSFLSLAPYLILPPSCCLAENLCWEE